MLWKISSFAVLLVSSTTVFCGIPQFTRAPQSVTVKEGETVTLACSAIGFPMPTIIWRKAAQISSRTLTPEPDGSLVLRIVKKEDEGLYVCIAESGNDVDQRSAFVTVNYRFKPFIAVPPTNQTVAEDVEVEFQCLAVGKPSPAIIWQKTTGNLPLKNSINNDGNLNLQNLQKSDSGFYECKASNSHGVTSAGAYLNVLDPIVFLKTPRNQKPDIGGTALLECQLDPSKTPATITWLKDTKPLNSSSKVKFLPGGNLVISLLIRDDMGLYTCQAKGVVGTVTASAVILLPGAKAPTFTLRPADVISSPDSLVSLSCLALGVPSPAIAWKKNGKSLPDVDILAERYSVTGGTLDIRGAIYEDTGNYTCTATNVVDSIEANSKLIIKDISASIGPTKSLPTSSPPTSKGNNYGWPGWFEWNTLSIGIAAGIGGVLLLVIILGIIACCNCCVCCGAPSKRKTYSEMDNFSSQTSNQQASTPFTFPNPNFQPFDVQNGKVNAEEGDRLSFNPDEFEYEEDSDEESDEETNSGEGSAEESETEESSVLEPIKSVRRPSSHPAPQRQITKKKVPKEAWDYRHSSASQYSRERTEGRKDYGVNDKKLKRTSRKKSLPAKSTSLQREQSANRRQSEGRPAAVPYYSRRHSNQPKIDHDMTY